MGERAFDRIARFDNGEENRHQREAYQIVAREALFRNCSIGNRASPVGRDSVTKTV
jgi:hypothetical protein